MKFAGLTNKSNWKRQINRNVFRLFILFFLKDVFSKCIFISSSQLFSHVLALQLPQLSL